jgi:hypothetical protein
MRTSTGTTVCNICGKAEPAMIEVYWASGNRHFCEQCWPLQREYYEDQSGQRAWVRIGNYFAPRDD